MFAWLLWVFRASSSNDFNVCLQRLARELKIWAQARHPNILELIGFHLSENYETAQLISPFMRHGNVSQYIARVGPEVGTRIEFVGCPLVPSVFHRLSSSYGSQVKDTAAGLEYLHTCDPPICHGDLKAVGLTCPAFIEIEVASEQTLFRLTSS